LVEVETQTADPGLTATVCTRHDAMLAAGKEKHKARGRKEQARTKLQQARQAAGRFVGGVTEPIIPKPDTAAGKPNSVDVTALPSDVEVKMPEHSTEDARAQLWEEQPGLTLGEYATIHKSRVRERKPQQQDFAIFRALVTSDSDEEIKPGVRKDDGSTIMGNFESVVPSGKGQKSSELKATEVFPENNVTQQGGKGPKPARTYHQTPPILNNGGRDRDNHQGGPYHGGAPHGGGTFYGGNH
ncbi:unnamed protein product, partial [Pylaiella littoralis]